MDNLTRITFTDKLFSNIYYYYQTIWDEEGDPRVTHLPLMKGGPWGLLLIIGVYFYFVRILGPQLMKNRPPFNLYNIILPYNGFLVLLNIWFVYKVLRISNYGADFFRCTEVNKTSVSYIDIEVIRTGYIFLLSRLFEFLDTIFFILRKKYTQASNLHVIHHSLVPIVVWLGLKLSPGGHNIFFPFINSVIHAIMYTYYFLSTFGDKFKPYLWWKKYLTILQMTQFILIMMHSLLSFYLTKCHIPKLFIYLSLFNCLLFFGLFYSFYERTYKAKPGDSPKQKSS